MLQGGDTDTNAAIVGGILGAADGYSELPPEMKKRLKTLKKFLTKELKENLGNILEAS